ncbi:hypothetical protein XENOCAPTIV_017939 [Xenoophorus captivus]|uniref:Secreted protein n=1 Tax=Xenoophorus captivus TaxID=1517983 RepID=A0ABV0SFW2_9TELE
MLLLHSQSLSGCVYLLMISDLFCSPAEAQRQTAQHCGRHQQLQINNQPITNHQHPAGVSGCSLSLSTQSYHDDAASRLSLFCFVLTCFYCVINHILYTGRGMLVVLKSWRNCVPHISALCTKHQWDVEDLIFCTNA